MQAWEYRWEVGLANAQETAAFEGSPSRISPVWPGPARHAALRLRLITGAQAISNTFPLQQFLVR